MSRLQEEDDPYLIEEPSDEEPAQSSSEDEVDVLLHGTPEQKRKLIRECLTGESESSSDDEFQKEMEAELDCTMKNMEGKWKSQLTKQDEPLSNIQYIDSSSKGVHLPSGPLDCDHPSSRSRDLTTELSQPVAPRATPRYHHQGQQFPQHAPFLPTSCNTYHDPYYSAHFQHEDCDSWDYSYSHFRSPPQRRFVRSRSRHRDRSPSRLPPPQYWDQPCHSRHRRYHPDYCSYRRPPPSPTVSQPPWGYDLQPASSSNVRLVHRVTAPESTMMDPVPALVEEPIPFPTPTLTPTVIPAATTEPPPDPHLETVVDFEPFASSDSESDVSFSLDAFSSSSPSELVGGNRPDSPPDYLYTEQVTRMATSLGIEVEQQHPWVKDPVFDMMNTAVALPMPPRLIETVKSFWDKPSSRSPTSHYLETMYRVQEQDCSFLFRHPVTNSVVVKAAQSSNRQKALATPTDHEGRKLDIMGRKFYSTAALQLRIADYQACMSRYQYFLWEKLTPFFEYLPEDKRKLATGFQNEAFDLARQQICSTLHLGDCASRVMASAISLRRHAWLRSSGLDPETCSRIEDLPFNGDVLFGSRTDDIVKRAQKRRSTVRSRGLAQHQSRSRRRGTSSAEQSGTATTSKYYDDIYFDSDSEDEDRVVEPEARKKRKHQQRRIPTNDELFYDPEEDDRDQEWVDRKRRGYHSIRNVQSQSQQQQVNLPAIPNSDAVLNCPACMTTLCLDCQRHETYKTQYRAMFVMNCTVIKEEILKYKGPLNKKTKRGHKKTKQSSESFVGLEKQEEEEIYHPVKCTECSTEVAVLDKDEVFHFFNVLASHC